MSRTYTGRFAPSPSGPLHAGSLVAALASYLDARAHGGRWLVRIEDIDTPRVVAGADQVILQQLRDLGMHWDGDILWQSQRQDAYRQAMERLQAQGLIYPCGCTRREIADSALRLLGTLPDGERPYPGTCRNGLPPGREPRAWRVRMPAGIVSFEDRWLGPQTQDVARAVGDIILKRADGLWAYQLAVVLDDAEQGVTDIVRGADLLSSTARQILLGRMLGKGEDNVGLRCTQPNLRPMQGQPELRYMHVPLVMDETSGLKLSKQNGAAALDTSQPLAALQQAWQRLGGDPLPAHDLATFWPLAIEQWSRRWAIQP